MPGIDEIPGKCSSKELAATDGPAQPSRSGKLRRPTLRFRLACLVLACVLPVCVIAGLVVYYSYQYKRDLLEKRVLETTRALSMVVDQQLATMQASTTALATSPSLVSGDLAAFDRQAQTVLHDYPGAIFTLADATGQQLVNTFVPFGTPLPKRTKLDLVERVFETGKPLIVNLFKANLLAVPIVGVEVPVIRDGRIVYDLALVLPANRFDEVFSQRSVPPEWIVTIQDANRVLVARSRFPERYVGVSSQPAAMKLMGEADEGSYEYRSQEGINSVSIFHRSTTSGWRVVITIPEAVILVDVWQWLKWVIGGIVLLSMMGIGLALFLARRIGGSIHALIGPALALGSGEPVDLEPLDLAETNEVGQSLVKASQLLQQRTAERERAEEEIRTSRQQLREIIDGATETVVFVKDVDGQFITVNAAFEKLLGVKRDELRGKTDYDLVSKDRADFYRAVDQQVLTTGQPMQLEEVALLADGKEHVFLANKFPLFDKSGRPYALCSISTDITERKRAGQRIAHLASFPELNTTPILETDLQGKITYANPAARVRFPDIAEIGTKHPLLKEWSSVAAAFGTDVQQQVFIREIQADGAVFHQTFNYLPDAGIVRIYFADITERKRAEQELIAAKQLAESALAQLRATIDSMTEGMFVVTPDRKRPLANRAYFRIYGFEPDTSPEAAEKAGSLLERYDLNGRLLPLEEQPASLALRGETVVQREVRVRRVDTGREVITSVNCIPVHDATGAVAMAVITVEDITEHKRTEAALQESEERLRSVLENMSEGLMLFDTRGNVLYQNASSLRIHGFDPRKEGHRFEGECLKATWKGWDDKGRPLPPEEWPMSRIFREGRIQNQVLHAQGVETGYEFDASYNGSPLYDSAGKLIGGFITIRDITDHKRAQEALIRSEKLASVGRMAATIAHEINNPLESVMSLLFLAKESKELPESLRQYLETADAELNRIAHITRQSLGFYRESNGPGLTSVNAVLESTVDLLKSRIKAKQAVIEKQWDGDVQVTAVAGELRQVFSNLLANSLDAIDEHGIIKLRVSTRAAFSDGDRRVRVTVADNGKGISASSRQRIFEPFFTTKGTVGTGLGLWVSKQIVDKHGGTIRMRSSSNGAHRGTVFSVVLPIEPAAKAHSQSAGI